MFKAIDRHLFVFKKIVSVENAYILEEIWYDLDQEYYQEYLAYRYYNVQQRRWMLPSGYFCPSLCTKKPAPPPPSSPPLRPTPSPAPTPEACEFLSADELRNHLKDEEFYKAYLLRSPSQVRRSPNFNIDSSIMAVSILLIKKRLLIIFGFLLLWQHIFCTLHVCMCAYA